MRRIIVLELIEPVMLPKPLFSLLIVVATWSVPAVSQASLGIASAQNCMECHAVDRHFNAPSFKQIGARYKGDKTAQDRLTNKVLTGGGGQWGPNPMPPQIITRSDAQKVVAWILTLK